MVSHHIQKPCTHSRGGYYRECIWGARILGDNLRILLPCPTYKPTLFPQFSKLSFRNSECISLMSLILWDSKLTRHSPQKFEFIMWVKPSHCVYFCMQIFFRSNDWHRKILYNIFVLLIWVIATPFSRCILTVADCLLLLAVGMREIVKTEIHPGTS